MSTINAQLLSLFVSAGVGVWMAVAGVHKNALEWRRRKRLCPSCGRDIDGRVCARCA